MYACMQCQVSGEDACLHGGFNSRSDSQPFKLSTCSQRLPGLATPCINIGCFIGRATIARALNHRLFFYRAKRYLNSKSQYKENQHNHVIISKIPNYITSV